MVVLDYGPRRIFMETSVLYYQREDRPRYAMVPMGKDIFRFGDLELFRLSFGRDKSDNVVKLVRHYDNGRTDENGRHKGRERHTELVVSAGDWRTILPVATPEIGRHICGLGLATTYRPTLDQAP